MNRERPGLLCPESPIQAIPLRSDLACMLWYIGREG